MRIYSAFALPWFSGAISAATWGQSAGSSATSQTTGWSSPPKISSAVVAVDSRERRVQHYGAFLAKGNTCEGTLNGSMAAQRIAFTFRTANAVRTQPWTPLITSVEPNSGKIGDELTAKGNNLGSDTIAALYLTDGKADVKVPMLAQTATSIRFRIPPAATPGRFA